MGRSRWKKSKLRPRWDRREASQTPDQPQGLLFEGDRSEEVQQNRHSKVEALVERRQSGLIVVLEDTSIQYNAGAALRSCDAFGVSEVWFVHNGLKKGTSMRPEIEREHAFNVDSKSMGISSASANRWVSTRTFFSSRQAMLALRSLGFTSAAVSSLPPSLSLSSSPLIHPKLALWMGNEEEGLSEVAETMADFRLKVDTGGVVGRLNLSVETAVCLCEVSRQREGAKERGEEEEAWTLTPLEQSDLIRDLVLRKRSRRELVPLRVDLDCESESEMPLQSHGSGAS